MGQLLRVFWPLRLHRKRPRKWLPKGRSRYWLQLRDVTFHLTARRWIGMCAIAAYRGGTPHVGSAAPIWRVEEPSMKKRGPKTGVGGEKHLAALESRIFADMLPLVEHCALRQYDDGEARETGWITLKTQGAAWCVQVKDPDSACAFTAVAETLDKALETAALLLSCDDAPWEPDSFLAASKARKKK